MEYIERTRFKDSCRVLIHPGVATIFGRPVVLLIIIRREGGLSKQRCAGYGKSENECLDEITKSNCKKFPHPNSFCEYKIEKSLNRKSSPLDWILGKAMGLEITWKGGFAEVPRVLIVFQQSFLQKALFCARRLRNRFESV